MIGTNSINSLVEVLRSEIERIELGYSSMDAAEQAESLGRVIEIQGQLQELLITISPSLPFFAGWNSLPHYSDAEIEAFIAAEEFGELVDLGFLENEPSDACEVDGADVESIDQSDLEAEAMWGDVLPGSDDL